MIYCYGRLTEEEGQRCARPTTDTRIKAAIADLLPFLLALLSEDLSYFGNFYETGTRECRMEKPLW